MNACSPRILFFSQPYQIKKISFAYIFGNIFNFPRLKQPTVF